MLEDGRKTAAQLSFQFPQFFVTAPGPCPYLKDREERKVFTDLCGPEASELHEALGRVGFRRSQTVAYRPACDACNACVSVRVVAPAFEASKSQRRVLKRNAHLIPAANSPMSTDEQYALLTRYLGARHADGGMLDMDEFEYAEMIEASPVTTTVVEYREPPANDEPLAQGRLIAVAITDVLTDGLSMVYSFFDPDLARQSLGSFMILDHIERTKRAGLDYVYLGYWVAESQKMAYKTRFQPMQQLGQRGWTAL